MGQLRRLSFAILLFLTLAIKPGYAHSKALIYRGPGACEECPETVARLLKSANIESDFIGPGQMTLETLKSAALYIQPGGTDYVQDTMSALSQAEVKALQTYVNEGGRYLGICAGGYLAGEWAEDPDKLVRGFGFIPGVVREESKDRSARVEPIDWLQNFYWLYFQDGPYFDVSRMPLAEVWAVYARTGHAAAVMNGFGKGRVGLIGPHPEAELDWYTDDHLVSPDGLHPDLEIGFIQALLK
jgi:glutamine amidotransferase-like uncharacterized protein